MNEDDRLARALIVVSSTVAAASVVAERNRGEALQMLEPALCQLNGIFARMSRIRRGKPKRKS